MEPRGLVSSPVRFPAPGLSDWPDPDSIFQATLEGGRTLEIWGAGGTDLKEARDVDWCSGQATVAQFQHEEKQGPLFGLTSQSPGKGRSSHPSTP